MTSWPDIVSFAFILLGIPLLLIQLWAFTWPNGEVSKRLHPSPPSPSPFTEEEREDIKTFVRGEVNRTIQQLRLHPPVQPASLQGMQLVTTVRRSPRGR